MKNKYAFLVIAVIVVIASGGFLLTRNKPTSSTAVAGARTTAKPTTSTIKVESKMVSPSMSSSSSAEVISGTKTTLSPSIATNSLTYKDGVYDVVGTYQSPAGQDQIEVKLTLKKDLITDVNVVSKAPDSHNKSQHFQGIFIANYKPLVVGKNIDEVQLDKVSGSSLTPQGFNDAIQQIKQQAKA